MRILYKFLKPIRENYIDTLGKLYEYSTTVFRKNIHSKVIGTERSFSFSDFKEKCDILSKKMTQYGIGTGDKVAILSPNMPEWAMAFFSSVAFGRISIPILPDCSANEVTNILRHSESKVLFVSRKLLCNVSEEMMDSLVLVIDIESFETIKCRESCFTCDGRTSDPMPDDIAAILYTSGTTGNAKGVVLSHRNFVSCVHSCYQTQKAYEKDRWLSILPMAHTLELTLCCLYPMYVGATVHYMSKPPVPSVLLKAIREVRPTILLSVPLIIEKIYRNSIVPTIRNSRVLSWMDKHMHALMCRIVGFKLKSTFGGKLRFFGIGGAKLNPEVEAFLLDAGFPYAIGYGLTETAPLLSYSIGKNRIPGSIGRPVYGVQLKLNNVNPETGEGEIIAKGPNVMLGYYKDPDRTKAAFTEDGWFRTNDLACVDAEGKYFIKGRLSNMILGASGENIYPEEIENVINGIDDVNESVVMQREGRLVALVNFNENVIDWDYATEEEVLAVLDRHRERILSIVNRNVNKTSRLSRIEFIRDPFEKTATKKIRRFKYAGTQGL